MLYDLSVIWDLANNDKEFVREIVSQFLADTGAALTILNEAIQTRELERVGFAAHRMKSTLTSMGMSKVRSWVDELEQLAHSNLANWEKVVEVSEKIQREMNVVANALRTEFDIS